MCADLLSHEACSDVGIVHVSLIAHHPPRANDFPLRVIKRFL